MTQKEYALFTDGEAWVEHDGHLYECIGKRKEDSKWILSDVNDGFAIYVSDNTLRHSPQFWFTYKY